MTTTQETPDSDRLSRLEVTVDYLVREVGDIKADLRQMRTDSGEQNRALREAMDRNRQELQEAIDKGRQELQEAIDMSRQELQEAIDMSRQESRRDFRVLVGTMVTMMVATWALIGTVLVTSL